MKETQKQLLRNVLISGDVNVETYEQIKKKIFTECGMNSAVTKDRALWSNWINCKSVPNRFCQKNINTILQQFKLEPIYDETTND